MECEQYVNVVRVDERIMYVKLVIGKQIVNIVSAYGPQVGLSAEEKDDFWDRAPNDRAYKRWSCHSKQKLLCKFCRTFPPPAMGARFTFFGHAGHVDPLDGWRGCSQKRVMSRPIQV